MQIDKIRIENFKGLRSATFEPTQFACLVGENNAGKSTVLQSVVYALNRPTSLSSDFFYDKGRPIVFRLELSGIDEGHLRRLADEHRPKISELIVDGRFTLIVRYQVDQRGAVTVERLVPAEERYREEQIQEVFKGKRGSAAIRQALIEAFPEFADGAPQELNITQAKEYVTGRIGQLGAGMFTTQEGPLPSGISSSVTTLLPEPIYIPAVKNLSDDLKTSQSTTFGRLLGLLLEDMSGDLAIINEALEQLNSLFNRTEAAGEVQDGRHERVQNLERTVEGFLRENFPTAKIELRVPPPELKTILNSAQIYVDDGSRDLVENKGDGIKRSLTFALLRCYVERMSAHHGQEEDAPAQRPLIFLFEEPELYLHPKSQKILFSTLARIAERFQVVVTTHSPLFFAPGITASFVRVAKELAEPKPIGVLYPIQFALDAANAETFRLAYFENAEAAFFSQRVVLFEGESDDAFFKHVAKLLNPDWDFDARNVAMVRVSGKGNFAKFRRFFEAFGLKVKIVADLDAFFEGFEHLGVGNGLNGLRSDAIQGVDRRIAALGTRAEPKTRQIKQRIQSETWRGKYDAAKSALRAVQASQAVDQEALSLIEGLFVWEDNIARVKACCEDADAHACLIPALDELRRQGICILSRGAIEDYYPAEVPGSGAKPDRALRAISLVPNGAAARTLSAPLANGREVELYEICHELFTGL